MLEKHGRRDSVSIHEDGVRGLKEFSEQAGQLSGFARSEGETDRELFLTVQEKSASAPFRSFVVVAETPMHAINKDIIPKPGTVAEIWDRGMCRAVDYQVFPRSENNWLVRVNYETLNASIVDSKAASDNTRHARPWINSDVPPVCWLRDKCWKPGRAMLAVQWNIEGLEMPFLRSWERLLAEYEWSETPQGPWYRCSIGPGAEHRPSVADRISKSTHGDQQCQIRDFISTEADSQEAERIARDCLTPEQCEKFLAGEPIVATAAQHARLARWLAAPDPDSVDKKVNDAGYGRSVEELAGHQRPWSASFLDEQEAMKRSERNAVIMREAMPPVVIEPDGRMHLLSDERLTKRQEIAAMFMAGLLAQEDSNPSSAASGSGYTDLALSIADNFLRRTETKEPTPASPCSNCGATSDLIKTATLNGFVMLCKTCRDKVRDMPEFPESAEASPSSVSKVMTDVPLTDSSGRRIGTVTLSKWLAAEMATQFDHGNGYRLHAATQYIKGQRELIELRFYPNEKKPERPMLDIGDQVEYIGGNRSYNTHIQIPVGKRGTVTDCNDKAANVDFGRDGHGAVDLCCLRKVSADTGEPSLQVRDPVLPDSCDTILEKLAKIESWSKECGNVSFADFQWMSSMIKSMKYNLDFLKEKQRSDEVKQS